MKIGDACPCKGCMGVLAFTPKEPYTLENLSCTKCYARYVMEPVDSNTQQIIDQYLREREKQLEDYYKARTQLAMDACDLDWPVVKE